MSEDDLEKIFRILAEAGPEKPWKTARYLAGKAGIPEDSVETFLLAHVREAAERGERPRVRYSSLPSRRTLEVLWGDLEKVGERPLENLTKDDLADETLDELENVRQPDVFLSHSHRDYQPVMELARYLLRRGVVPWLAETHIGQGEPIHDEIIGALKGSQHFLLFLSPNALDSRWTGKEYSNARAQGKPIFIVADIRHEEIRSMIKFIVARRSLPPSLLASFGGGAGHFVQEIIDDDAGLVQFFPWPQEELDGSASSGNLRPLCDLIEALHAR